MATKLRLARHGKKGKPFYHIVVADARAKRDGRYIERIGSYNPNTNPATIDINFDRALDWVMKGAQPTDTVRAMLSYRGILYKKHLLNGVKKGALTNDQVEERFNAWLQEKEAKIEAKRDQISKDAKAAADKALSLEKEKSDNRATALAEAAAQAAAEAAAEETTEAAAEETTEAATEETTEAAAEETTEAAAEETTEAAAEETPEAAAEEEKPKE